MLLTVLSIDKLFGKDVPMYTTVSAIVPTDVIDAYNKGIKDALETNPTNAQLEVTCAALWFKQQENSNEPTIHHHAIVQGY